MIYCAQFPGVYKVSTSRKHSLDIKVLCMYTVYLLRFVWREFR